MNTVVQNKEYFSTVIDAMSDLVRVVDKDGIVLLTNRAMEKQFGNCIGKSCFECWGYSENCEECVRKQILAERKVVNSERTIHGRCYSLKAAPVFNAERDVEAVVEVFRDMTDLAALRANLVKANAKMTRDLSMARKLQRSMMKKTMPNVRGYRFYSEFYPCEAVGGDAIDCLLMPDGRVLVYVADVSGHGVHAAILTVFLKQEISFLSKQPGITPFSILTRLHEAFIDLNTQDRMYITMFLVLLDPETGVFEYMNAGHSVAPIFKQKDRLEELYLPGTPICRWGEPGGELGKGVMEPGDRFLLFSDGMICMHQAEQSMRELKQRFMAEPFDGRKFIEASIKNQNRNLMDDLVLFLCERE